MWAMRQSSGTKPSLIDLLKIHVIGVQSSSARFFRRLGGMSSGPAALDGSSFSSFFFTASSSILMLASFSSSGPLHICAGVGTSESSLVKTEVKKLLRASAVSCSGCRVTPSSFLSGPTASLTFCLDLIGVEAFRISFDVLCYLPFKVTFGYSCLSFGICLTLAHSVFCFHLFSSSDTFSTLTACV